MNVKLLKPFFIYDYHLQDFYSIPSNTIVNVARYSHSSKVFTCYYRSVQFKVPNDLISIEKIRLK